MEVDLWLLQVLNGFAALWDGFEDVFEFLANEAELMFVLLLAAVFLARGKYASANARHGVVAAGLSALLGLAIAHLISGSWDRPRPYEAHADVQLFVAPNGDPSFPSDHATAAFAIAFALFLRSRKVGWVALAMAAAVSISRVAVGIHYPSDVAAGAVIGAVAALTLWTPPARDLLHRLADRLSDLYERLGGAASRQLLRRSSLNS